MKLNKIEKLKIELSPFEYYKNINNLKIENIKESDRFYLKNFGIYNTKLNPEKFMLRIRIAGGRVKNESLLKIIHLAKKYEAKILITARAQIELHNLSLENVIKIHKNLEENKITTFQTLTDNFRNIITDPLDGIGKESVFEVYPIILKMQSLFLKNPEFIGMIPRKFNTAISANIKNISSFFGNDCYFALAKKNGVFGFNIYLGGKNTEFAKSADIFVKKEEVIPMYDAIIKAYKKYGLRENRTKARLFHLIEKISMEGFKEKIEEFYNKKLQSSGELISEDFKTDDDWFELKNKKFAYRFKTDFGEIDIETFENLIKEAKDKEIRLGVDQNIYIIGFSDKNFSIKPLSNNQNITVCAGSRYCIYSLFDTKKESHNLILKEINRYRIKVGYSGCLKGCGRHILADIGFVGIRTNLFGKVERGVRLYLGGLYTKGEIPARLIFWAVPLRKLNDVLKIIIDDFKNSGYKRFEEYSKNILLKFNEQEIAYMILSKLRNEKIEKLPDDEKIFEKLKNLEKEAFSQ
ncbi:hypothetical protein [Nitrosophilus kaiyonis]|uniref:hypothetical protein n=1 Tax=Nitrosophilus kaiyonis TaxID=2930200 RepID=UPI0024908EEF|nr:hypothetical protein [Nitrosophilus kaiyonis]